MANIIKRQDVCFGIRYKDGRGDEKTRWNRIGKAFHYDNGGVSIKLDMVPAAEWDGWINLFDERTESKPQSDDLPY